MITGAWNSSHLLSRTNLRADVGVLVGNVSLKLKRGYFLFVLKIKPNIKHLFKVQLGLKK